MKERSWSFHLCLLKFFLMSLRTQGLFNSPVSSTRWLFSIYVIKSSIQSSLAFWYQFPGEEPPTPEWAGELVAPYLGLLVLRSTSESGKEIEHMIQSQKVSQGGSARAVDLIRVEYGQLSMFLNHQKHRRSYPGTYYWSILPLWFCLHKWSVYPQLMNLCSARMLLRSKLPV